MDPGQRPAGMTAFKQILFILCVHVNLFRPLLRGSVLFVATPPLTNANGLLYYFHRSGVPIKQVQPRFFFCLQKRWPPATDHYPLFPCFADQLHRYFQQVLFVYDARPFKRDQEFKAPAPGVFGRQPSGAQAAPAELVSGSLFRVAGRLPSQPAVDENLFSVRADGLEAAAHPVLYPPSHIDLPCPFFY